MDAGITDCHLWQQSQWQQRAYQWIRDTVQSNGLGSVFSIEQTHVRTWSTVLRIKTSSGLFWFKANNARFIHEASLLDQLSLCCGPSIPQLVAWEKAEGWFLSEHAGMSLADVLESDPDIRRWENALSCYGALQRELESRTDDMLNLGVPDCRPHAAPVVLEELLEDTEACLIDDNVGMTRAQHKALWDFLPNFKSMCDQLAAFGIAATLQHDDLHRSNIFLNRDRHVFIDWADASVAHPFGSLIYPLLQASELLGPTSSNQLERLRDAYLEPWTDVQDRKALRSAADLAVTVASVGRALAWRRAVSPEEREAVKEYYASGVPRWLQKLLPA